MTSGHHSRCIHGSQRVALFVLALGTLGHASQAAKEATTPAPLQPQTFSILPLVVTIQSSAAHAPSGAFFGLTANFSAHIENVVAFAPSSLVFPEAGNEEGCKEFEVPGGLQAIAVVRRGTCTFVEKAQLAQKSGAGGLIVVSDTDSPLIMSSGNQTDEDFQADIPCFSLGKDFGDAVFRMAESPAAIDMTIVEYEAPMFYVFLSEAILVSFATCLVMAGAYFSTADMRIDSPLAPRANEEVVDIDEGLSIGFFVMGSAMLVILFFLMKYLIYFLIFGFSVGGFSCMVELGSACLCYLVVSLKNKETSAVPFFGPIGHAEIIAGVPAFLIVGTWVVLRNTSHGWMFQDTIATFFLCHVQRTLRLPNIKIASVLLVAMFFFDIFWVFLSPMIFGQSVMVGVATGGGTGESVPMLLRIPPIGDPFGHDRMLGFGDIVLPGLLVSYLRRHDIMSKRGGCSGYFVFGVIGYFIGLCITIVGLVIMQKGQPALLYLVPCTLGTTVVLSALRGEFWHLWAGAPVKTKWTDSQVDLQSLNEQGMLTKDGMHPPL